MPTDIKIVDKTMRKEPATGKMVKSENYRGVTWTERTKTKTRGGVVRKRVVGEKFEAIQGGKPVSEKSVKIEKFDRFGKLKKATVVTSGRKLNKNV